MWVVFTDEMIYKPWVKCSRPNNLMLVYYALDCHSFFFRTAGIRWAPALARYYLLSRTLRPPTCGDSVLISLIEILLLHVTRQAKGRYDTAYDWMSCEKRWTTHRRGKTAEKDWSYSKNWMSGGKRRTIHQRGKTAA